MADDYDSLQQLGMFDDPTRAGGSSSVSPSFFKTLLGICLLICGVSFGTYLWDFKTSPVHDVKLNEHLEAHSETKDYRWGWKPYLTEYQLYQDKGFDLEWLENPGMAKARKLLGEVSPFFELFLIRLYGLFHYLIQLLIVFAFALSLGSVRYHVKRTNFRHISSTFNNASIKVLIVGIPLLFLWAVVPFGVSLPVVGEIPLLINMPLLGEVWLSSPLVGIIVFGFFFSLMAYILGANFSREI